MANDVSVKIGVDNSAVSAGLAQVRASVNEFKEAAHESFKEVGRDFAGMFAAGSIIEFLKGAGEQMEKVQKLALRFGESTQSIQRVSHAAEQNGTDMETVAKAMQKVNANAVEAAEGNGRLADSFGAMGIDAAKFIDLPMEERLEALADAYAKGQGNAVKMAEVQKLMGKSAGDLIPLLSQGSEALRGQFDEAKVDSTATVNEVAEANETLKASFEELRVWGAEALGALAAGARGLGEGLAVVVAYLGHLKDGFKAAEEAAKEAAQASIDLGIEKQRELQAQIDRAKNAGVGEGIEANRELQDSEAGLQKLRDSNNERLWQAHLRNLSLQERELEIRRKLLDLSAQEAAAIQNRDEAGQLKASNSRLDLEKELSENLKRQGEEEDEADRKANERKLRNAKERLKKAADAEKDRLEAAEGKLHELEQAHTARLSVDSLRQAGGNLHAGAAFHDLARHEDTARQALNQQRLAVEHLKALVKLAERAQSNFDSNGAFNL